MSDHYCCHRCGQRYDYCDCDRKKAKAKPKPKKKAKAKPKPKKDKSTFCVNCLHCDITKCCNGVPPSARKIDYVTGELEILLCRDVNTTGKCPYYLHWDRS